MPPSFFFAYAIRRRFFRRWRLRALTMLDYYCRYAYSASLRRFADAITLLLPSCFTPMLIFSPPTLYADITPPLVYAMSAAAQR